LDSARPGEHAGRRATMVTKERNNMIYKRVLVPTLAAVLIAAVVGWPNGKGLGPIPARATTAVASVEPTAGADRNDETVVTESVATFIDKGKPIGHVILALLVIAVFLAADQIRVHVLEQVRARELLRARSRGLSRTDFEELALRPDQGRIGRLLAEAVGVYRQSADLSLVSTEAEVYREREEHRFNTFESRMAFLSDTAGGLGLLGTVWGIYRGFAAKAVAQTNEELLGAMGIALVTTFLGIVVSVIINWLSTETGAAVRGRIMAAIGLVDTYRELLIKSLAGRSA
jgi:biopolymer transport protein ExbB/TolQ